MNKTPSIAYETANLTANAEANFKNHGLQSGMSLVALLVAIGIRGVLSVVISQSFKFNLDES